ncbi:MAG: undecaprenyldiphospho-muramoylpentapeptide beta-N-acetylglucosaminyltransferase [Clostridiales bacterium]|nr:undecaprenyldiphospho-muramoylpentapeptide beta-N-acetylglucosaminyltransferase [Clostridiales bacterium]
MKKIVLTGGGTAGHVTPNIAMVPSLKEKGCEIYYIGSKTGIEKELIEKENIPYYGISSGKLRRYLNKENLTDVFRVMKGVKESLKLLSEIKPDIIFSKGGYVAVPVAVAAGIKKIPLVCHESDITPGLANKLASPFAKKICTSFPETLKYIKGNKGVLTGTPIREQLFEGKREKGLEFAGFNGNKPVVLIMGGSLGSVKINTYVRNNLKKLTEKFDIIHLCGKGNVDNSLDNFKGYRQYEYISDELKDIFAASDIVCARAGSNSIFEYLALKKPMLLIPLSKHASRGDQILNSLSFKKQGFAEILKEYDEDTEGEVLLDDKSLVESITKLYENREKYIKNMSDANMSDGVKNVINVIEACL